VLHHGSSCSLEWSVDGHIMCRASGHKFESYKQRYSKYPDLYFSLCAPAVTGRNPNVENSRGYHATKLHQLDLDGLPFVGAYLEDGDALFRSDAPCTILWRV